MLSIYIHMYVHNALKLRCYFLNHTNHLIRIIKTYLVIIIQRVMYTYPEVCEIRYRK